MEYFLLRHALIFRIIIFNILYSSVGICCLWRIATLFWISGCFCGTEKEQSLFTQKNRNSTGPILYNIKQQLTAMQEKRYPKGHFIAIGVAAGLPLGIPIGIIMGTIAIGPVIGIALGLGSGIYLEKKYNPLPLTMPPEQETQRNRIMLALGAVFLMGIAMFVLLLLNS